MVASVDPSVPVGKISTLEEGVSKMFATRRLTVLLISLFSGVSLFLSAIGLYGILAYSVTRRTRGFALRIALGARSNHILGLVMVRGLEIVCTGLAI
jgi:ABC-type antimicrobial peptide transport system permease subunit